MVTNGDVMMRESRSAVAENDRSVNLLLVELALICARIHERQISAYDQLNLDRINRTQQDRRTWMIADF